MGLGWMSGAQWLTGLATIDESLLLSLKCCQVSSSYCLRLGKWMLGASPDPEGLEPRFLSQPGLAVSVRVGNVSHSGQVSNGA
jgi:hypothetical protein